DPLLLRRDRGVPPDGDPPARLRRDGDHGVRHHEVSARPLRGRVDGPPRGGGRRGLRGGTRPDAVAVRPRAPLSRPSGSGAPDGVRRATNGGRGARRFGFPPDPLRISVWLLETWRLGSTMAARPPIVPEDMSAATTLPRSTTLTSLRSRHEDVARNVRRCEVNV